TVGYEMYCQLLEEATRQLKNEPKPSLPEAHVELTLSAFIPKTYIPGDRQRLDVYRRLTRCTSLEMCEALQQDVKDAFGEAPRQDEGRARPRAQRRTPTRAATGEEARARQGGAAVSSEILIWPARLRAATHCSTDAAVSPKTDGRFTVADSATGRCSRASRLD